jgi:hypothetical protein
VRDILEFAGGLRDRSEVFRGQSHLEIVFHISRSHSLASGSYSINLYKKLDNHGSGLCQLFDIGLSSLEAAGIHSSAGTKTSRIDTALSEQTPMAKCNDLRIRCSPRGQSIKNGSTRANGPGMGGYTPSADAARTEWASASTGPYQTLGGLPSTEE